MDYRRDISLLIIDDEKTLLENLYNFLHKQSINF